MPVTTILLALSLAATPAAAPSRLDPDDIEALEALLRAMDAQAEAEAATDEEPQESDTPEPAEEASFPEEDEPAAGEDPAEEAPMDAPAGEPAEDQDTPGDEPVADPAVETQTEQEPGQQDAADDAEASEPEDAAQASDEPESRAETPAPATTQTAETAILTPRRMTPHVGMEHYTTVRGAPWGPARALSWQVSLSPLGEDGAGTADRTPDTTGSEQTRTFFAGSGWAGETGTERTWLYDFAARRLLTLDQEDASYTNTSLFAAARRNIDIYVALSRGGQAEDIPFGPAGSFHRFWLEAAMAVASGPAGLTRTARPAEDAEGAPAGGTVTSWYRQQDGAPVASAWTGCEDASLSPEQHRSLMTAFAHRLALHPDILSTLRDSDAPLCALSFTVISPESPQGRVEHWALQDTASLNIASLGFADARLEIAQTELISGNVRDAVLSALRGEGDTAPSPESFLVEINTLRGEGDFAGALLTLVQETAHFGLCPAETIGSERLACAGATSLAEAGTGDDGYEAVAEATEAAADGAHRLAIQRLLPYLDRDGYAGSAARTIAARQLVEWGEEGLAEYETLDPAGLLSEALAIDPFAANIYWYLALRYMAAGAPDEAWFFLDTGRALPGREPTETLMQARGLERRLEQLAPALFAHDAAR